MPQRLPPLTALRAFDAVARTGSVRRAATELHVTPGAVSQQLKVLEADLGVTLVRRRGNTLELTDAALRGRDDLGAGFRLIEGATERMRARPERKQLRLSVEPAFAANWLIARLPRYRALPGSFDLLLDPNKAVVDLEAGEADLAIRFGKGNYPRLDSVRLFEDEIFPVCAPALLRRGAKPGLKRLTDLSHHTLLRLEWSSQSGPWPDWPAWLQAMGLSDIPGDHGPGFPDTPLLLRAAIEGQGVALGQTSLVKDLIRKKQLVAPFAKSLKTGFGYYLVYPREAEKRVEVAQFREWLEGEAGEE